MAPGVYPNVPLNVVSVTFTKDCLPTGDQGLPLRYSVMLGLSRPISYFELAELDQIWPGTEDWSFAATTGLLPPLGLVTVVHG